MVEVIGTGTVETSGIIGSGSIPIIPTASIVIPTVITANSSFIP